MNTKNLILSVLIAVLALGPMACETAGKRTAIGAGTGAAVGALAGGIIGHQSGNTGAGAAIGAATGAALGGGVGYYLDRQAAKYDAIEGVEAQAVEATNIEEEHIELRMSNEMLFEKGSSSITPEGAAKLKEIAALLRENPDSAIIVKGYASSEGEDEANFKLSERRAEAVCRQLVANQVNAMRIQSLGMGESDPIADNSTEAGRVQNRRVEISVFPASEIR